VTEKLTSSEQQLLHLKKITQIGFIQAEHTVEESEVQINHLTQYFTELVELELKLSQSLSQQDGHVEIINRLSQVTQSIIMEFQFFDCLKQKITHAVYPLKHWSEENIVLDPYSEKFVNLYSTEEERSLYQAIISQPTTAAALTQIALNKIQQDEAENEDDFELF